MYHIIAAKHRAHLCRGQHRGQWQITRERTDLAAPALRAVQGLEQQRDFSGADGSAHLLKPGNGETSATRQTDPITATLGQHALNTTCELRGYGYWPACCTREKPFRSRALEDFAARR
jgi:hypothetical protein